MELIIPDFDLGAESELVSGGEMSLFRMDSQEECYAVESVKQNNAEIERVPCADASDVKDNGSCGSSDVNQSVTDENIDVSVSPHDGIDEGPSGSPPMTAQSAGGLTPPTSKGRGLKKWRRIRRDVVKDGNMSIDASKILKRGISDSGNMVKPSQATLKIRKDSEGSVGSTSVVMNTSVVEGFGSPSVLDLNFASGPAFAACADSDRSEDRSSKSSTAASVPIVRHDSTAALGYARERNRTKNLNGKGLGQQGKSRVESTKKPRGERFKLQKENSRSSVESDLRSSNSAFMQGAFSAASNGMKSGKSLSYYSGNTDGTRRSGQYSEVAHASYPKENFQDGENISQDGSAAWEGEEDKDENHRSSADQDPLVRSMQALLSVQEALEKEVEKFTEIAMEPVVPIAEAQMSNLMEKAKSLEVTLEETRMTTQARESRISELETALSDPRSQKEESTRNRDSLTGIPMDELETTFKQKIEAEIEYLAIVRTIQTLMMDLPSQFMLLTEKETAGEQTTTHDRLDEAETKAALLEKRAEELEEACEGIVEAEDVLKLQRGACKATRCFFLQLLLLVLVVWLLVLQLLLREAVVIPT